MNPTIKRRGLLAVLATTVAFAAVACNTDGSSTNGGTSGGGGTVTVVADPKISVDHTNCYAGKVHHSVRVTASGLNPYFQYELYLYHPADNVNSNDPKKVFRVLSDEANSDGKGSYSISCKNKKDWPKGSYAVVLRSSQRKSNRISFDVLRTD
jgi:hypothetical protein